MNKHNCWLQLIINTSKLQLQLIIVNYASFIYSYFSCELNNIKHERNTKMLLISLEVTRYRNH